MRYRSRKLLPVGRVCLSWINIEGDAARALYDAMKVHKSKFSEASDSSYFGTSADWHLDDADLHQSTHGTECCDVYSSWVPRNSPCYDGGCPPRLFREAS
jgi:hypothetical protein